jgi:HAD superfamily phosphatase (TIGR01668 family)
MKKGFKPDYYLSSIESIEPDALQKLGIKALFLDIDNTLVPNHEPDASDRVISFINKMQKSGIKLLILSNAREKRVERFNRPLGLLTVHQAMKPFSSGFSKALKMVACKPEEVMMVGDQIFTDIYGANACGLKSLLVVPIHPDEPWFVQMKRGIERLVTGSLKPADHL